MQCRCPICGKVFGTITNTHLRTHNITMDEFVEKYPRHKMYTSKYQATMLYSKVKGVTMKPWTCSD